MKGALIAFGILIVVGLVAVLRSAAQDCRAATDDECSRPAMDEPAWCESLRWQLHSVADWFAERRMWRTSIAIDRCALAIYRAFDHGHVRTRP